MKLFHGTTLLTSAFALLASLHGNAQLLEPATTVGTPQTALHGTDIESVDLLSGALQVRLPLLDLPGRGIDTHIVLTYSSKLWETDALTSLYDDCCYETSWFANLTQTGIDLNSPNSWGHFTAGWSIGIPHMGYPGQLSAYMDPENINTLAIFMSPWTELDGTTIGMADSNGSFGNDGMTEHTIGAFKSYDNTFAQTVQIGALSGLKYKDGTFAYYIPGQTTTTTSTPTTVGVEDTNGNVFSCTGSQCTDTVGRLFNLTANSQGFPGSLDYTDSSGAIQHITIKYSMYTLEYIGFIQDGCNIHLYGLVGDCTYANTTQLPLPITITMPGGGQYQFQYVMNSDGTTTGELSKIILPGGGYIRYVFDFGPQQNLPACEAPYTNYCQPNRGENRVVTDRYISPDGSASSEQHWSYSIRQPYQLTTGLYAGTPVVASTATKPTGEKDIRIFQDGDTLSRYIPNMFPQIVREQQTDASGTVLRTTDNSLGYDASAYNVLFGPYPYPNPRIVSETTTLNDVNLKSTTAHSFGTYGNETQTTQYDWGATGTDSLLSRTTHSYWVDSHAGYAADAVHILDRVQSSAIYDSATNTCQGVAAPCAQTTYGYDEFALQPTTNAVSHDFFNFPTILQVNRGNQTSVNRWLNSPQGNLITYTNFNDLGRTVLVQDPKGYQTTYSYADSYVNFTPSQPTYGYVTRVTLQPTGASPHIRQYQYYYNTGKVAAACGENFADSCVSGLPSPQSDYKSFSYDFLNRVHCLNAGDGGSKCYSYVDTAPLSVTESTLESAAQTIVKSVTYDGLGRTSVSELVSDPVSPIYTQTSYDSDGRVYQQWNPTRCFPITTVPCVAEPTWGYTTYEYDYLDRKLLVIRPDDTPQVPKRLSWNYTGNAVDSFDEVGSHEQTTSDGLGRLTKVMELGTSTSPFSLQTNYGYDPMGNLLTVNQIGNMANGESPLARSFTYDSVSRLIASSNPESKSPTDTTGLSCQGALRTGWTMCYSYDPNGNLSSKTDARSITTAYGYDPLNRLTSKTYNDGTASACFLFDTATNGNGRLGSEWTQSAAAGMCGTSVPASPKTLHSILSYDPMGRVWNDQRCTGSGCSSSPQIFRPMTSTYDLAGNPTGSGDGVANRSFVTQYDAAGRLFNFVGGMPGNATPLFTVWSYGPVGPTGAVIGYSMIQEKTYDSRTRLSAEAVFVP